MNNFGGQFPLGALSRAMGPQQWAQPVTHPHQPQYRYPRNPGVFTVSHGIPRMNQPVGGPRMKQPGGDPRINQQGGGPRMKQPGGDPRMNQQGGGSGMNQQGGGSGMNQQGGGSGMTQKGGGPRMKQPGGDPRMNQQGGGSGMNQQGGGPTMNQPAGTGVNLSGNKEELIPCPNCQQSTLKPKLNDAAYFGLFSLLGLCFGKAFTGLVKAYQGYKCPQLRRGVYG